jgi:hypothetical protein
VNDIYKNLADGKEWAYLNNLLGSKLILQQFKVTCDGTFSTILSVIDYNIQNELIFKTDDSCVCECCSSCNYQTFVVLGKNEV